MGLDKVIIRSLGKVAKDTGKLNAALDGIKDKIKDRGLELIQEAGIDTTLLPVDMSQYLSGESPINPSPNALTNPDIVCSMPVLTDQQNENTTRLINQSIVEIEEIYITTNRVKEDLNSIKKPVNTLNGTISPTEAVVDTVDSSIKAIKAIPIPVAFGMPAISLPVNVLTIFSSTLDSLDKLVSVAKGNLGVLPATLESMTEQINEVINNLNRIEQVIDPFLQTLVLVRSVVELRPNCPDVTAEDIAVVRANLLNLIQGNLAVADEFNNPFAVSDENLEADLAENADPGLVYKNFKFVLEYDPNNEFFFPSRRIKCTRTNSTGFVDGRPGGGTIIIYNINPQTNPYLEEGAYSYSGNLRVLIEEAKFAVDTYTGDITLWSAPQVREQVAVSSSVFIDTDDEAYLQAYEEATGFLPSLPSEPLPAYIRYGGSLVNLNSSPTDIEYGIDRLYTGFTSPDVTSYIQSGTIQVNKPIKIRLKTFGGTGNSSDGYTTGFTEALLTIKRSFSIQDNIDPFTGRVAGYNQDAIDDFITANGGEAITILDSIYETYNEITPELDGIVFSFEENGISDDFDGTYDGNTFYQRLKLVKQLLKEAMDLSNYENYIQISNLKNNPSFVELVERLYAKTKPILFNDKVKFLSQRLFGGDDYSNKNRTSIYLGQLRSNQNVTGNNNWYMSARANSVGEDINSGEDFVAKAATLGMTFEAFKKFKNIYEGLYGNRADYNNGAWVGAASTLPIIPSTVGDENDDIEISLQATQLAGRNETINEQVGTLELLGTYTYDLEIIDSLPAVGGPDTDYPTNFTQLFIEVI